MSGTPWKWVAVASAVLATETPSFGQPKPLTPKSFITPTAATQPLTTSVLDSIALPHREMVTKVLAKPTVTTKYTEEPFTCYKTVYEWLLDHPDRTSLAWTRMGIPCVEIQDATKGVYAWTDEHGSQLTWQAVAKSSGQVIWYASGKVKAAMLLPVVPVKAVAIVKYPSVATSDEGVFTYTPEVTVHVQTDSRAANAIMRIAGPAMPKMAEQGAEQLLFFFSGVASYIHKHPEKMPFLLGPKKK
jgi:hypothetical protein